MVNDLCVVVQADGTMGLFIGRWWSMATDINELNRDQGMQLVVLAQEYHIHVCVSPRVFTLDLVVLVTCWHLVLLCVLLQYPCRSLARSYQSQDFSMYLL